MYADTFTGSIHVYAQYVNMYGLNVLMHLCLCVHACGYLCVFEGERLREEQMRIDERGEMKERGREKKG